ncbi:MFS transporter [Agrobacterium sp. ES01]|uniref:MFS transporter n=1 Tax=Agrobacterium sp. ES01 TaxID=3420714 RepID=UPI003D098EFD
MPTAGVSAQTPSMPAGMSFLMAAACGLIAANLYYAQPLAGPIAASVGLPAQATGLIVTLTQIGYGLGLLLLVPLGDLVENRKLILGMIGLVTVSLLAAAISHTAIPFLVASLAIGLGSVAVQMIVPLAAHMAPDHARGRVVGNVMSGLMLGIMLARPFASFIARFSSWHMVFFISAGIMIALAALLAVKLPRREPETKLSYDKLLGSMRHLVATQPVLRRRALYQAFQFAAFSLFWTVTPLYLAGPAYNLTQAGIALFALAGVAGAIASPIAGHLADRNLSRPATVFGMLCVLASFAITHIAEDGSTLGLGLLTFAAILLDFGVTTTLVTGQRAIFSLGAHLRSRLNGLYMATFFTGGALGSAIGAWAFANGGWFEASMIGIALPISALFYFLTEDRRR